MNCRLAQIPIFKCLKSLSYFYLSLYFSHTNRVSPKMDAPRGENRWLLEWTIAGKWKIRSKVNGFEPCHGIGGHLHKIKRPVYVHKTVQFCRDRAPLEPFSLIHDQRF